MRILLAALLVLAVAGPASATPVSPGDLTGFGFDTCHTQSQATMDRWLQTSPFLAVGVYMSGEDRYCADQPLLTRAWVRRQSARGWRVLPLTVGPQAACAPSSGRYRRDVAIDQSPAGHYARARSQGLRSATTSVAAARRLGIPRGSTLWYDLEAYDLHDRDCRESALRFLSAWTSRLHGLGYVSGVYSSAGSGIEALDHVRIERPTAYVLPDQIWLARYDGVVGTTAPEYVSDDGWQPHDRIKQYLGGHVERWGGIRVDVDRDYLDVGRGTIAAPESHCDGVPVDATAYPFLGPSSTRHGSLVRALKCLLRERHVFRGPLTTTYDASLIAAVRTWRHSHGLPAADGFNRPAWVTLLAAGAHPVVKVGSGGRAVRRLQRALDAASPVALPITGVFGGATRRAVRDYQHAHRLPVTGVCGSATWAVLAAGG